MSTPSDNGPWTPQCDDDDAQQAAQTPQGGQGPPGQDPWAVPQDARPAQDPWAQPQDGQHSYPQYGQQNPYGAPSGEQGHQQYGQQNPDGTPQAGQPGAQQPHGQVSGPSASDPYGQGSGASASDPYGQASNSAASDPYSQAAGPGQQNWTPAGGPVPSGADPFGQPGAAGYGPQGGQQAPMGATADPQAQSRLVVGLLGIFLGGFGVHRFLLGYTTIGILQIVLTLITCGIGAWWGIIEGIMVLAKSPTFERDARGRPLTD